MTTVYFVRHAHAGDREDWDGDDRERPLSKKGRKQAQGIAGELQPLGVRRLISSSYARCTQTLEPLAEELGLKVEVDDRLAEGAGLQALEVVREAGDRAALSTHGDICSDLLEFLGRQGVVRGALQTEKGSTWVLELEGSRIVAARYLPAPG